MAVVLGNRAKMSTSTTGTGTITLGSALSGYQTFAQAGITNGQTVRYAIEDGTNFEIGSGVFTSSGTTLTRNVTESSNSDNAINLSGSGEVFITASAADIFVNDGANSLTTTGVITGGTVEATSDTAAGDNAAMGYTSAEGLILTGQGSTNDITIKNDADTAVISIPTGGTNVDFVGSIDVANVGISTGVIDLKNSGSQSVVKFYCESSNAHYAEIKAPAHGAFSGNVTLTLPATTDTIAGIAATQTFTNKTLTAPKIADGGFIADANGNELVVFQTTGSAVNQLEITNNASGSNPILAATGGDTNIGIALTPKGTGEIVIAAGNLNYAGTAITTTGAEINLIDGGTARGTTAVASGDGILINDAGTMRMTNVDTVSTYFSSHSVGGGNIVTTGALNSGSITSGFGSINNGSSAITTTGVITGGTLEATTDTAAGDNAAIGYTAAEGLILTGQGSTSDITLKNDADATVFTVPTGTDDILFPDNAKAMFGAGSDLQIYHDGSHSIIRDAGTGNLRIWAENFSLQKSDGSESMIFATPDDSVILYYNGNTKFFTTNSGVSVTGNVVASGAIEPAGDTAAGDNAAVGYTSAEGLILTGQGSTNDVTIKNDADADVIEIPTGTTSVTMTGSLKPLTYQETYVAKSAASTVTCDLATGTSFSVTMDQNTTFAFTNPPGSGTAFSFTLFVTQHSTAVTLTWPNTVDWAGGSAPDAAGNNEVQAYAFFTRDGGTTYYGFLGGTAIA